MSKYPELSSEQWDDAIKNLEQSFSKETSIEISGGEPLLRKELTYSIIKKLRKHFKNVGINSNGSLLNEQVALELKNSGATFAKISLYSIKDSIHDALRGFPNAAKNAKKAIELLQKQKIKTDIGVLITSKNISEIPSLIKHYNHPRYDNISIVLQPLDEPIGVAPTSGKSKTQTINNLWPNEKDIKDFFYWLKKNNYKKIKNSKASLKAIEKFYINHHSALNRRCLAGQRSLVIYPDGNLSFCFKRKFIGNIAKDNLKKILSSKEALAERLGIKKCEKYCRIIGCNFSKTIPEILKLK